MITTQPIASFFDTPPPVLLNTWKHHAGALRLRIASCRDDADLGSLAGQLVVIGTELMDLYTGQLTPGDIAAKVIATLQTEQRLELEAFRTWILAAGGYRVLTFADQTQWVLRLGPEADRFVHVHPGRWAPETRRVRANVLKTAVMVLAHVRVHGGDPEDVALVNQVRQKHLGLSPIRALAGDQGLSAVIDLLRTRP